MVRAYTLAGFYNSPAVPLGGSEARLLKALNDIEVKGFKTGGQCSMVNGIAASKSMLNAVGEHSNREIIFVVGSLNTIDVTSPFATIETGESF